MDYIFNTLGMHKCELAVSSDNAPAIHCYEKVGFVREGVIRSSYLKNGKWMDVGECRSTCREALTHYLSSQSYNMGMLEDEWRAQKKAA